jgi:hypothetical protein
MFDACWLLWKRYGRYPTYPSQPQNCHKLEARVVRSCITLMNDQPDLSALLQALADARAALPPEITARLPPDLRHKYDLFREDLDHMAMRAQALRPSITPAKPGG